MRVVITGGAGFLGSHLCEALLARGDTVVCVDDLSTGRRRNLAAVWDSSRFSFVHRDVVAGLPVRGRVDAVAHLASPASPPDYHRMPLETLAVGSEGTRHALELARRNDARFVLASTSEVYGDPQVHPQHEDYWGHVNSVGPRSVYDEAKRYAEALTMAYRRTHDVRAGIVRIFNTYGPRMRAADGRVVSSFVAQALNGDPLTIYGDGSQTRSFCYVDDLVAGLVGMLDSDLAGPVNLGSSAELTVLELAELVLGLTGSGSAVERHPLPVDDPVRRRPDTTRATEQLGWVPRVDPETGLRRTIEFFRAHPQEVAEAAASVAGPQDDGRRPASARAFAAPEALVAVPGGQDLRLPPEPAAQV
jgi:dTDP-glucose 4,6-dehydratase